MGNLPPCVLLEVLTNPHLKYWRCYEKDSCAFDLVCSFGTTQAWKMDMRFFTWNVRSLYRSGPHSTVARKLARYKLDVAGVQEVRWDKAGAVRRGDYISFLLSERRMKSQNKH